MTTVEAVRSSDRLCFQLWGTSGLMLPSLGCSLGSASLRAPLCLQESSFGSPWLVLPLLQVDCWDAVGVSVCSLSSVSLTVPFHRPSSKGAFVNLLLCMAAAVIVLSWGRVRYISSLAFSPWRWLSAWVWVMLWIMS